MGVGRRMLPLAAWIATLVGLLLGLGAAGDALPSPPLTQPSAWLGWLETQPPVPAMFGVLRVAGLAIGFYLLATTLLTVVARGARAARMIRVADTLTVPAVRRLAATALGVGLTTATLSGLSEDRGPWSTGGPTTVTAEMVQDAGATVGMASLGDAEAADVTLGLVDADDADDAADADAEPSDAGEAPATVVIASGDHLWGLAERVLAARSDRPPSEDGVAVYWQRLIEANRDRLADPANPDLIYPGQELRVPAVEGADGARSG